ncbi:predicted protein [Candida tropicalis MYA-3404]|uniref:Uncharacterized protein n=1 Tax=Candida tropicalis (strain ATCC MYA-3404 / T1) TaxID=294747 RepID=C5M3C4_CANTT|nr:predicted protein [Candida tropicalis MYA-3404]EER35824.1 predicted protein [Candida tropicalis MYA-3404]KAG4409939.1 hypothetical protein JTP64_000577 [Candida tropicalis]
MSTIQPITPRKSKKILSPISPSTINIKNRQISESTGLVKFSLSPKRQETPTTPQKSPTKSGFSIDVPISKPQDGKTIQELQLKQRELLDKYSTKQAQLHEYERLIESKKLELLEISKSIEEIKRQEVILLGKGQDIYKQAYLGTQQELNKLRIKESPKRDGNNNNENQSPLKKQASFIMNQALDECNNVKKKASLLFVNQNEEFQNLIKSADEKFDLLSKQTSKFFNNNFKIFDNNAKKNMNSSLDIANSSFNVENLDGVIYERSFEDNSLVVDIDDYDSSFE